MKASKQLGIQVLGRVSQILIGQACKSFLIRSVLDHCRNHVGAPLVSGAPLSRVNDVRKRVLLGDSACAFANYSYHFSSVKDNVFKPDNETRVVCLYVLIIPIRPRVCQRIPLSLIARITNGHWHGLCTRKFGKRVFIERRRH
jgi:hypothetical protein